MLFPRTPSAKRRSARMARSQWPSGLWPLGSGLWALGSGEIMVGATIMNAMRVFPVLAGVVKASRLSRLRECTESNH